MHCVQANILRRRTRVDGTRHITLAQAVTIDYSVTWHVRHDSRYRRRNLQIV